MTETNVNLNFSFVHDTEIDLLYNYYIQGTSVNPSGDEVKYKTTYISAVVDTEC